MKTTNDAIKAVLRELEIGFQSFEDADNHVQFCLNIDHIDGNLDKKMFDTHVSVHMVYEDWHDKLWVWVVPIGIVAPNTFAIYHVKDDVLLKAVQLIVDLSNKEGYKLRIRLNPTPNKDQPEKLKNLPETEAYLDIKKEYPEGKLKRFVQGILQNIADVWTRFGDKMDRMLSGNMADLEGFLPKEEEVEAVRKFVEEHPEERMRLRSVLDPTAPAISVSDSTTSKDTTVRVSMRQSRGGGASPLPFLLFRAKNPVRVRQ